MALRVGVVVGESSGDNLAANLIRSLRRIDPNCIFEGVVGPACMKEGARLLYPMERLAVMGLVEPLARLPELYQIRRELIRYFTQNPPDFFLGVDAPDFNIGLECILRKAGIKVVHYVSPSVWAWRKKRIVKIKKAVDLMLTLFPFESVFYQEHQVPVCFVGHPLADQIPIEIDTNHAREQLKIPHDKIIMTIMPGSRSTEIKYLAEVFVLTARYCFQRDPRLSFLVPLVCEQHKTLIENLFERIAPELPFKAFVGKVDLVLAAADLVLVTSGTATLETMLYKNRWWWLIV